MFGSVEQLVPLHKMFTASLEAKLARRSPGNDSTFGDVFLKFAPFFKVCMHGGDCPMPVSYRAMLTFVVRTWEP